MTPKMLQTMYFNIQLLMYVTMFFVVDIITFLSEHTQRLFISTKIASSIFIFCAFCVKNTNEIFTMIQHFYE